MPSRASATPAFLYVPTLGALGSQVALSEAESHYVSRVCRARPDDVVHASNGRGSVATLRLGALERSVRATIESLDTVERLRTVWMLCGEPEGQRDDWMVEKLAELGVARWTPIDTQRAAWQSMARRHERWERRPDRRAVRIRGHHEYNRERNDYDWHPGHWDHPPHHGERWEEPRYRRHGHEYRYSPGRWK